MQYAELLSKTGGPNEWAMGTTIALDPGGTTGIAVFVDGLLTGQDQYATGDIYNHSPGFIDHLGSLKPDRIVLERYAIYSWKATEHSWDEVQPAQLIGVILYGAAKLGIPAYKQTAQAAKGFVTDDRLKEWGFWIKGERHARDAIRHGCYWSIFGPKGTRLAIQQGQTPNAPG